MQNKGSKDLEEKREPPLGEVTKRHVVTWIQELREKSRPTEPVVTQPNIIKSPKLFQGKLSSSEAKANDVPIQSNATKIALTENDRQNLIALKKCN